MEDLQIKDEKVEVLEESEKPEEQPIFTRRKQTNITRCRYCEETRPCREMTSIPKSSESLKKWVEILGPVFAENIKRYSTNRICRTHLVEAGLGRRRARIKRIGMVNEVENDNLLVLDDERENRKMQYNMRQCRYCGVSRPFDEMTSVPRSPYKLMEWVEILGPKFHKNVLKFNSTNMICWTHFETKSVGNELKNRLPVKMKEDIVEDPPKDEDMAMVKATFAPKTVDCRYCEAKHPGKLMTSVPKNPKHLVKWIEILGRGFYDRWKMNNQNFICLSHFELPQYVNRRGTKQLPKRMEGLEHEEMTIRSFELGLYKESLRRCLYCDELCEQQKMTHVPKSSKLLAKWIDILGEEFSKKVEEDYHGMLCLSHFDLDPTKKNRGANTLPKRMEDMDSDIVYFVEEVDEEKKPSFEELSEFQMMHQHSELLPNFEEKPVKIEF